MLITVERHDDFEEILLARGLFREGTSYIGTIRLYAIDKKTVVTYTSDREGHNYVFIHKNMIQENESKGDKNTYSPGMRLSKQILDPILRESHTPKEYKVKRTLLYNGEIGVRLINIESGDIKVLSAVEGLDHAIEIFEDVPVEIKETQSLKLEEALTNIFISALLV